MKVTEEMSLRTNLTLLPLKFHVDLSSVATWIQQRIWKIPHGLQRCKCHVTLYKDQIHNCILISFVTVA